MTTIQERIAALKLAEVGRAPSSPNHTHQHPGLPSRNSTTSLDQRQPSCGHTIGNEPGYAPQPPQLSRPVPPTPPRTQQSNPARTAPPPSLPPRNTPASNQLTPLPPQLPRRGSANSIGSSVSAKSSTWSSNTSVSAASAPDAVEVNRVKAPAYDPSNLPALPPKRTPEAPTKRPSLPGRTSTSSSVRSASSSATVAPRKLPPVPSRGAQQHAETVQPEREAKEDIQSPQPASHQRPVPPRPPPRAESVPAAQSAAKPLPTPQAPKRSALSYGMNKALEQAPQMPARPTTTTAPDPSSSAPPDLSAILASKPKFNATASNNASTPTAPSQPTSSCLKCRDFSGPDTHAARFPRTAIPSLDLHWLAKQLTSPFPSHTDKARAIFTWLHHNIAYDTVAFFGNNVKPSTPASTLSSGMAVCEGYAGLFAALAAAAGLSATVVGGHGKGIGYTAGSPVPTKPSGHAWNAVQIDNGEWKLIDPCWGAGHVCNNAYVPAFNAGQFTMSNAEFGMKHYPENQKHLYLPPGTPIPSFRDYWLGPEAGQEPVTVFSGAGPDHGIDELGVFPRTKLLQRSGRVRFELWSICEHWDNAVHGAGRPYVMILMYNGETKAFETDGRRRWWCEVDGRALGPPGEAVNCMAVTSLDGRNGRGISVQEYTQKKGRVGMGFEGVAGWTVA